MKRSHRDRVLKLVGPLSLYQRVVALEREVVETRRLNQRLSDVVDEISELLVPVVDRDDERVRTALARIERPSRRGRVRGRGERRRTRR